MPLPHPILDNRSYEQIRNELVQRIPVYTPEWTDHNVSDPGITLIELFSFLSENLLYRFNQIPEATQLEFLRLLQIPLREAKPARNLVSVTAKTDIVRIPISTKAKAGRTIFETLTEVRVLPLTVVAVSKAAQEQPDTTTEPEEARFFEQAMRSVDLDSPDDALPYQSDVLDHESGVPVNFDNAVDGMLWLAALAEDEDVVNDMRQILAKHENAPLLLNIGFIPEVRIDPEEDTTSSTYAKRFRCPGEGAKSDASPVEWQISTGELGSDQQPIYRPLRIEGDTTAGLTQEGVVRLRLPRDLDELGPFAIDNPDRAGTGDLPPPLEDDLETRIVFWLRAFRHDAGRFGKVLYLGANCTEVVQTVKAGTEFLGTGNGQPNQTYDLINKQVVRQSLILEVEEADGWRAWEETDGFHASTESNRHYVLDAEAGRVSFGNGLQGYTPQIGQRIRARSYRYGGGVAGNVAPGAISKLEGIPGVKCENPFAAHGGEDAEPIERALDRIPSEFRRHDRAVTRSDFQELALMTPGARIGRAECLPRFHPMTPEIEAAGVVSVIVWPQEDPQNPNAPMPNQNQLRSVCQWLDARRLVTTEMYVLPPIYRPIAVAIGLEVKPGYGIDAVRHWVELIIRQYLAPLPPYGPEGAGWPLGRAVHGPELEAAALQVEGVRFLNDLKVVGAETRGEDRDQRLFLQSNEVPELVSITVEQGPITIAPGDLIQPPDADGKTAVPVPVIREVC